MDIRFKDSNEPVIVFQKPEARALTESLRLCGLLAQRLDDEDASAAQDFLTKVIGRYVGVEATADAK